MQHAIVTAGPIAASSGHHFSIGPWIIVPILMLVAIFGTVIFGIKDRRRRRAGRAPQ